MDVLLNEEESSIKSLAREVLADVATPATAREAERSPRGYSADLWREMATLDWLGLCLPEKFGGMGLPSHYLGLLLEEIGRHIAPVPLHSTLTAALAIARTGSNEQRETVLPSVANGSRILTVAHQEGRYLRRRGGLTTTAVRDGDDYIITGTKNHVDSFRAADSMVVSCADGPGVSLFLVDTTTAGVTGRPLVTLAKDDSDTVVFDHVRVPAGALLGEPGGAQAALDDLLDQGTALLCAQIAGAARKDAELAVEHSENRVAFGRPIGAFQAIQHLAADMLIALDGIDLLTHEALWRMGEGLPAAVEASQAKSFANDKSLFVVRSSQQIHGGMGFMMEFDLHLWYRRVVSWTLRYGTTGEHRARIASAVLDVRGPVRLGETQLLPAHAGASIAARALLSI